MTRIGWVRHGITDWNIERRAQGQTDIPLNETGRSQARALAERLAQEKWDAVYSSDLSRALETATIIADSLRLPVISDERLRERYFGEMEGTTPEERRERWGANWDELTLGKEPDEMVLERGLSFIRDVLKAHPGQRILAVSHGAMIAIILKHLIPQVPEERIGNTSITTVVWNDQQQWDCERYNCTLHIDQEREG